ncbi:hypothetical protein [Bacillus sp. FJAT-29814]|uniref:hypothetical protein n=1 Tax=Bacillus sp. FJAT-29814 TaxID=1729688 RepID=UPI00082F8D67|nr:hypothetical protein [Bacillus sp. FJAT-29814]
MLNVEIRRPRMEEIKRLNSFFRIVITDTFIKEGLGEKLIDINDEIKVKEKYLESDFESNQHSSKTKGPCSGPFCVFLRE